MRIIYIYQSLAIWGGIERILVEKMNYLVSHYGFDVYMFTTDQGNHEIPYQLDNRVKFVDFGIQFHFELFRVCVVVSFLCVFTHGDLLHRLILVTM
jgi:hypothetical protein